MIKLPINYDYEGMSHFLRVCLKRNFPKILPDEKIGISVSFVLDLLKIIAEESCKQGFVSANIRRMRLLEETDNGKPKKIMFYFLFSFNNLYEKPFRFRKETEIEYIIPTNIDFEVENG